MGQEPLQKLEQFSCFGWTFTSKYVPALLDAPYKKGAYSAPAICLFYKILYSIYFLLFYIKC
jgi:hypothetical protein